MAVAGPGNEIRDEFAEGNESVPVQIGDTDSGNIVSAEVFLSYDGDLLTATGADLAGTLAAPAGAALRTTIATRQIPRTARPSFCFDLLYIITPPRNNKVRFPTLLHNACEHRPCKEKHVGKHP